MAEPREFKLRTQVSLPRSYTPSQLKAKVHETLDAFRVERRSMGLQPYPDLDMSLSSVSMDGRAFDVEATTAVLDWAAEIRRVTHYEWALCLRVAEVWYYG